MLKTYGGSEQCGSQAAFKSASEPTFDGQGFRNAPFDTTAGSPVTILAGGFSPGSQVDVSLHSDPTVLGSVVANESGVVEATVTMPSAPAGVHAFRLNGIGAGGVGVGREQLVRYPGSPTEGETYGIYVCCFEDGQGNPGVEKVDVSYGGIDEFITLNADADGRCTYSPSDP